MKKTFFLTIIICIFLNFHLFAGGKYDEYEYLLWDTYMVNFFGNMAKKYDQMINPYLANVITVSYWKYQPEPSDTYSYDFIWESDPQSTFWFYTFSDSANKNKVTSFYVTYSDGSDKGKTWRTSKPILVDFFNKTGFSFSIEHAIEPSDSGFRNFVDKIKESSQFNVFQSAVSDTADQYFAFGAGYFEQINFKDASSYGINKEKLYYFVLAYNKIDSKWLLGYIEFKEADEALDSLTCISSDNSITEPLSLVSSTVYPNPTAAENIATVRLELEDASDLRIVLSDVLGQEIMQIYEGFADAGTFTKSFTTQHLQKGVYFLKTLIGGQYKIEKIVVND